MPFYHVMIHATGIQITNEDIGRPSVGFYTRRIVKAEDETAAEYRAVASAMDEWVRCGFSERNRTDGITYTAEEISELSTLIYLKCRLRYIVRYPFHRGKHGAIWYTDE